MYFNINQKYKKIIRHSFIFLSCFFYILAILNPVHELPWVSLHSEKYSFISFILLFIYFSFIVKEFKIPYVIFPLLLICFIPIVQYFFGLIIFFETMYFSFIYLLNFFLLILVVFNLKYKIKFECLFLKFCYLFVFISFISSFIIIVQWLNFGNFQPYLLEINNTRAYGNLAQPNHMATILCMGLIGLWYIYEIKIYSIKKILFISLIFLFCILLTQSRTAWVSLFIIILFYCFIRNKINIRIRFKEVMGLTLFFILNALMLPIYNYLNPFLNIKSGVFDRITTGHERLDIWKHFIYSIMEQPLWGYGWYQTQKANVSVLDSHVNLNTTDSSHNLILDIILWCGIPVGGFILIYFAYLLFAFFKSIDNKKYLFCFVFLIPLFVHSMFEYPLNYFYFLLPFGFLIGLIIECKDNKIFNLKISYIYIYAYFFTFLISIFFVSYGYQYMREKRISELYGRVKSTEVNKEKWFIYLTESYFFDKENFIAYWVKFNPYEKMNRNEILELKNQVEVVATKQALIKYAILLAYNGYEKEANSILIKINHSYGEQILYSDLLDLNFFNKICRFCYDKS